LTLTASAECEIINLWHAQTATSSNSDEQIPEQSSKQFQPGSNPYGDNTPYRVPGFERIITAEIVAKRQCSFGGPIQRLQRRD
jgi:hypothetical protein